MTFLRRLLQGLIVYQMKSSVTQTKKLALSGIALTFLVSILFTLHDCHLLFKLLLAVYKIADDEIIEDDNLQIIGETDPREDHDNDWDNEDDSIPVRLLKDFTVYKMEDNTLVHIAELITLDSGYEGSSPYGASGIVEPYVDNHEEDEDEDDVVEEDYIESSIVLDKMKQTVKLSTIIGFNIHDISKRTKRLNRYLSLL